MSPPLFIPTKSGMWYNPAYLIRRTIAEAIKENAAFTKGVLLDYGCGARPYESLFICERYVSVDILVSGHPQEGKKADLYFDGGQVPVDDESVDGVLASEVFEHVFDLPFCLRDIHRVLKPGGQLLATCPFVWPLHEVPYDFARYTPYALRQLLEAEGFKILKLEQRGQPVEVLGQMFLECILPGLIPPIPKVSTAIRMMVCGLVSGISRLLAKIAAV
jgi:SAM-dependent methyltransferase